MASPEWETLKAFVATLSSRALVEAGKALNNGSYGVDFQKQNKEARQAHVRNLAYSWAKAKFGEHSPEGYAAALTLIQSATVNEAPEVVVAPMEAEDDEAAEIAAAVAAALKGRSKGLSQEQVTAIVDARVRSAISEAVSVYRVEVKHPDGRVIELPEEPRHEVFGQVLTVISCGIPVLLVGPAGTGKTHLMSQVAAALGLNFGFSGAVGSEYKLLGFLNAEGKPVITEYRKAYEFGGLFGKDEIDASSPAALLSVNAGIANGHQDFPDGVVKRHADFRLIAAANTYGHGADRQYVGRNQLDAASTDRFFTIAMGYDEKLERTLYGDNEWTRYVHKARAAIKALSIRHVVSMRALDMGHKLIAAGMARQEVEAGALWKHLKPEDVAKIKGAM